MTRKTRMTSGARLFILIVGGAIVLTAAGVATAAAAIYSGGTIAVDVAEQDGGKVAVHVPAGLANLILALVPDRVLEHALDEARADLDPRIAPALRSAWDQLAQSPDFVLFELDDAGDRVRVEKIGKKLLVHVDSDGAVVDVSVPVRTVERILAKL